MLTVCPIAIQRLSLCPNRKLVHVCTLSCWNCSALNRRLCAEQFVAISNSVCFCACPLSGSELVVRVLEHQVTLCGGMEV